MVRKIGNLNVSDVGFGAMSLSMPEAVQHPSDTVHAALSAGATLIDTADIYAPSWRSMGHNERLIAAALRNYPGDISNVVVATKAGITRGEGESWGRNGSLEYLRRRAEAACDALGLERLPLFYLHRPDRSLPFEDSVRALAQLQRDGLVDQVGLSNVNTTEISLAVDLLGVGGLAAVQNEFSPWFRSSRAELELCAQRGVAFVAYSPLGGTGERPRLIGQKFSSIGRAAEELGISPQRIALAWELSLGKHVIPIPGARRPDSIKQSALAMTDTLTKSWLDQIDKELADGQVL